VLKTGNDILQLKGYAFELVKLAILVIDAVSKCFIGRLVRLVNALSVWFRFAPVSIKQLARSPFTEENIFTLSSSVHWRSGRQGRLLAGQRSCWCRVVRLRQTNTGKMPFLLAFVTIAVSRRAVETRMSLAVAEIPLCFHRQTLSAHTVLFTRITRTSGVDRM